MTTSLIFGGSGKVARLLTKKLVASPQNTVYSVIRKQSQVPDIEALGAKPIVQSIEDSSVEDLTSAIRKAAPNVVIWSAGAGGGSAERTRAVDHEGAVKVFDATAAAGVKRFVIVSAIDVRDRANTPVPEWYSAADVEHSDNAWKALATYYAAKLAADTDLVSNNARRGLAYTIVRPGLLSDDAGSGKVSAGKVRLQPSISREDVAEVVVGVIADGGTVGLAFDVVGGDTPIKEALREVAEKRIDVFEGRY